VTGPTDGFTKDAFRLEGALSDDHADPADAGARRPCSAIDPGVLATLQAMIPHDAFCRIIETFVRNAPGQIDLIRHHIRQGQHKETLWQAHNLKGTSGNLGATALCQTSHEIENAIHAARYDALEQLGQTLLRHSRTTWDELHREFKIARPDEQDVTDLLPEAGA
jgi:HPt (histidine-containing phosphotransfer) domain-containing protein